MIRRSPRNQLAKEILENLTKFPHCILLTRVGQFYEVRFTLVKRVLVNTNASPTVLLRPGSRSLAATFDQAHKKNMG